VEVLAGLGADVNRVTPSSWTPPLFISAREGHLGCVEALVRLGAALDAQKRLGSTAVNIAGQRGRVEIIGVLAAAGADVNLPFHKEETPVYCTVYNARPDFIHALAAAGANLDRAINDGRARGASRRWQPSARASTAVNLPGRPLPTWPPALAIPSAWRLCGPPARAWAQRTRRGPGRRRWT
jgi:ankyrin repeat protein